jgi:hypothetical protein
MKKLVFTLTLFFVTVFMIMGQSASPKDLILLLDTSSSMSAFYRGTNDYLTGPFLGEFLRIGDTFHLIPFSGKSAVDISRRVEGRGDVETIIGRMLLQYPLEPWSDIFGALSFAEQYAGTLPESRPKKIVLVTDGDASPPPESASRSMDAAGFESLLSDVRVRLSRKGIDLAWVKAPVTAALSSGRPPAPATAAAKAPEAPKPAERPPVAERPSSSTPERPPESRPPATSPTVPPPAERPPVAERPSSSTPERPPESRPPAASPTVPPPAETGPAAAAVPQGPAEAPPEGTAESTAAAGSPDTAPPESTAAASSESAAEAPRQQPPPPRRKSPAVESREPAGGFSADSMPLPLIIGLSILGILVLGLVIFLAARRLQGTPNRVMAQAAAPAPREEPLQAQPAGGHNTDLLNSYAASRKPRTGPYENKYRPRETDYEGPLLLNLFVEDQNTAIGKRNIHAVKSGYNFTVGGGRSDFLIFLVPVPSHIGEIRCEGQNCTFIPRKPQYFPDTGSQSVPDCIGKTIRIISDKNYEIRFRLERYEDPLKALNRLLHSVQVPG